MKHSARILAGAVFAATLLLAGCAGTSGADATGTWGTSEAGMPQLVLADDGTLSGTDGCNRLVGSWTQKGDTVTFGPIASTLMACLGVDTWLNGAASARIDGDTMTVLDAGGTEIGTLSREN